MNVLVASKLVAQLGLHNVNGSININGRFTEGKRLLRQVQYDLAGALVLVFGFALFELDVSVHTLAAGFGNVAVKAADFAHDILAQVVANLHVDSADFEPFNHVYPPSPNMGSLEFCLAAHKWTQDFRNNNVPIARLVVVDNRDHAAAERESGRIVGVHEYY